MAKVIPRVRDLRDLLAPRMDLDTFARETLKPEALGLSSRDQFFEPIHFAVRVSGRPNDPRGAIRVAVPVHGNESNWLPRFKQRFSNMVNMPHLKEDQLEFRTIDGRPLEEFSTEELPHVGRLHAFVDGERLLLGRAPSIPREYSATKEQAVQRWASRVAHELPDRMGAALAGLDGPGIDVAMAPGGAFERSVADAIQDSAPEWTEFVRVHNLNSPDQLTADGARGVAQSMAADVRAQMHGMLEAAQAQVKEHLAAQASARVAAQVGEHKTLFSNVGADAGKATDGSDLFCRLADDLVELPAFRHALVDGLYTRPLPIGACRWDDEPTRPSYSYKPPTAGGGRATVRGGGGAAAGGGMVGGGGGGRRVVGGGGAGGGGGGGGDRRGPNYPACADKYFRWRNYVDSLSNNLYEQEKFESVVARDDFKEFKTAIKTAASYYDVNMVINEFVGTTKIKSSTYIQEALMRGYVAARYFCVDVQPLFEEWYKSSGRGVTFTYFNVSAKNQKKYEDALVKGIKEWFRESKEQRAGMKAYWEQEAERLRQEADAATIAAQKQAQEARRLQEQQRQAQAKEEAARRAFEQQRTSQAQAEYRRAQEEAKRQERAAQEAADQAEEAQARATLAESDLDAAQDSVPLYTSPIPNNNNNNIDGFPSEEGNKKERGVAISEWILKSDEELIRNRALDLRNYLRNLITPGGSIDGFTAAARNKMIGAVFQILPSSVIPSNLNEFIMTGNISANTENPPAEEDEDDEDNDGEAAFDSIPPTDLNDSLPTNLKGFTDLIDDKNVTADVIARAYKSAKLKQDSLNNLSVPRAQKIWELFGNTGTIPGKNGKSRASNLGPIIQKRMAALGIKSEIHHPWNALIHHTIEPQTGRYPDYYRLQHTKQDMTADAEYNGDVRKTYRAYHALVRAPLAPIEADNDEATFCFTVKRKENAGNTRDAGGPDNFPDADGSRTAQMQALNLWVINASDAQIRARRQDIRERLRANLLRNGLPTSFRAATRNKLISVIFNVDQDQVEPRDLIDFIRTDSVTTDNGERLQSDLSSGWPAYRYDYDGAPVDSELTQEAETERPALIEGHWHDKKKKKERRRYAYARDEVGAHPPLVPLSELEPVECNGSRYEKDKKKKHHSPYAHSNSEIPERMGRPVLVPVTALPDVEDVFTKKPRPPLVRVSQINALPDVDDIF